jgi:hypothetical protein
MSALNNILIVIASALTLIGFAIFGITVTFQRITLSGLRKRFADVQSLFDRLETGEPVNQSEVYEYAKNVLTREATFLLLRSRNLIDLFPREFYTMEKAAESNLANWLEFPTELGACPDEIEFLKKVVIDLDEQNSFVHYYVYRFKVYPPHWASGKGWMTGVVGPYFENSNPYDHPNSTFSRLHERIPDLVFPEEEAKWVHRNISLPFGFHRGTHPGILRR